jgi:8-oxo-dGTP diphosphatase
MLQEYFADGAGAFLSHVSINCVVFGYRHPHLQVLVHRIPGQEPWHLPGGFVKKEESLDEAATRNLKLAGMEEVFLRQVRTFGDVFRVTGITEPAIGDSKKEEEILQWVKQRFVTVVYYGLIDFSTTRVVPGGFLNDFKWMDVDQLERMAMDHAQIVAETRKILSTELLNYPVASNLLPEMFTLNELRGLFERMLNRDIDRGTFRRKMLKLGIVEQIDRRKDSVGRPSHLYRFNMEAYQHFLEEETKFGF